MSDIANCGCGGDAVIQTIEDEGENHGGSYIECDRCGMTTPLYFDRKENMIPVWNGAMERDAARLTAAVDLDAIIRAAEAAVVERIADYHDRFLTTETGLPVKRIVASKEAIRALNTPGHTTALAERDARIRREALTVQAAASVLLDVIERAQVPMEILRLGLNGQPTGMLRALAGDTP